MFASAPKPWCRITAGRPAVIGSASSSKTSKAMWQPSSALSWGTGPDATEPDAVENESAAVAHRVALRTAHGGSGSGSGSATIVVHRKCLRIAVIGASGFVGRALSIALPRSAHDVVAIARHPPEVPGTRSPHGRRRRRSGAARRLVRMRGRLLPRALARHRRLPRSRSPTGRELRKSSRRGRRRTHRVSRWPRPRPRVGASREPPGSRHRARVRARRGRRVARRGRARRGKRLVRDAALPHRASALHGLPPLGSHRTPTDRARGRDPTTSSARSTSSPASTRSAAPTSRRIAR